MFKDKKIKQNDWWAEGDTPARTGTKVTYLIDGRITFYQMCIHFLKAQKYIYLSNWGMTTDFQLVRGIDYINKDQSKLISDLIAEGLTKDDIDFWLNNQITVKSLLRYIVNKGVEVKVLLWGSPEIPLFSYYEPKKVCQELEESGIVCLVDDSAKGLLHHPVESLHQKISVIDGTHAFVGGLDPMIQKDDFDRWDTTSHIIPFKLRNKMSEKIGHSWHDSHSLIEGSAVEDVELNFRQRWNYVIQKKHLDTHLLIERHINPKPLKSNNKVQIIRTIPRHTYRFDNHTIRDISQVYYKAFGNAKNFIYIENQYIWLRNFIGIDFPLFGRKNKEMKNNLKKLAHSLKEGIQICIILPDDPNVGREYTDTAVDILKKEAGEEGIKNLNIFCLANFFEDKDGIHYKPIYVHSKIAIIDDIWSTVGSANLNNRGMRDDTEMNVTALDPELALGLRLMLVSEHLGIFNDNDLFNLSKYLGHKNLSTESLKKAESQFNYLKDVLEDPRDCIDKMKEKAEDNFKYFKAKLPLKGHLLPYLTLSDVQKENLGFLSEHGWVEC